MPLTTEPSIYIDVEIDGPDDNDNWDYVLPQVPHRGDHIILRHPDENPRRYKITDVTWHPNAAKVTGRIAVLITVEPDPDLGP